MTTTFKNGDFVRGGKRTFRFIGIAFNRGDGSKCWVETDDFSPGIVLYDVEDLSLVKEESEKSSKKIYVTFYKDGNMERVLCFMSEEQMKSQKRTTINPFQFYSISLTPVEEE